MSTSATSPPAPYVEPVLDLDQIQGNVLLEFAKIHQAIVCLRLNDAPGAIDEFKAWLREFRPRVTSTAQVREFRLRLRAHFRNWPSQDPAGRQGESLPPPRAGSRRLVLGPVDWQPPEPRAQEIRNAWDAFGAPEQEPTWFQIGFSNRCLQRLVPPQPNAPWFADESFLCGMAKESTYLGDPPGSADGWRVGGWDDSKRDDVFLLIAHDSDRRVEREVEDIRGRFGPGASAEVIYWELAEGIDRYTPEHFGHADGFSQPGILGLVAKGGPPLTERRNPKAPDYEGLPGQQLIWPGSFVLGYADQKAGEADPPHGDARPSLDGVAPEWAVNGSYLAFRRLQQDVRAYREFLGRAIGTSDIDGGEEQLTAMLMGRWRDGTPIVRAPNTATDRKGLQEVCTSNHFDYQAPSHALPESHSGNRWCSDVFNGPKGEVKLPPSQGNPKGDVCPYTSHVRKMYPRDDTAGRPPDLGTRRQNGAEQRRILRRGLRYGTYCPPTKPPPEPGDHDRGLLFLAYQASLRTQFVWLTATAAGSKDQPASGPAELRGWDPIIGQNSRAGRERHFPLRYRDKHGRPQERTLCTAAEWVTATGGEYFFIPSCDALKVLSGERV